jgi:D-tyrosyl-tRNA(Tyr) deacylase
MRVLLQRVHSAEVRIRTDESAESARVASRIGSGFLLLVGFTHSDTLAEVHWMADKIAGLRLFTDADGRMNLDLGETDGSILVVSQFTLYGDARKGRRPSFIDAARPDTAIPLYEAFIAALRAHRHEVQTGEFGAMMDVELINDGPVTLLLEREAETSLQPGSI